MPKAKAKKKPVGLKPGHVCMTGPGGSLIQVQKRWVQKKRDEGFVECNPPKDWKG